MAEVNAKDLTTKTSPASTDSMLLFGTTSNEGAKITVDNLADNILGRLTTKTFANQVGGSSAATILAQLATLNSNSAKVISGQSSSATDIVGLAAFLYGVIDKNAPVNLCAGYWTNHSGGFNAVVYRCPFAATGVARYYGFVVDQTHFYAFYITGDGTIYGVTSTGTSSTGTLNE